MLPGARAGLARCGAVLTRPAIWGGTAGRLARPVHWHGATSSSSSRTPASFSTAAASASASASVSGSAQQLDLNLGLDLIVSKSCAKRIVALSKATPKRLRLAVEGGGCSGFQYAFELEDDTDDNPLDEDEDVIFTCRGVDGARVVVDEGSLELVRGSTIDFTQEMIRSSFAVVNNPNSESACGCGSSFAIKNFESNPALD